MKIFHSLSCCLFVLVVLLSSCSLQKRHYREGYHVQWNNDSEYAAEKRHDIVAERKNNLQPIDPRSIDLTASLRGNDLLLPAKEPILFAGALKDSLQQFANSEECDVIIQKSGEEIKAKVIEINAKSIKYKNCDDASSQEKVVKRSDVNKIRYSNGTEEIFTEQTKDDLTKEERIKRNTKNLSIFTLVLGIISLVPFYGVLPGVLAFVLGNVVLHKYRKNGLTEKRIKRFDLIGLLLGIAGAVLSFCLIILSFL